MPWRWRGSRASRRTPIFSSSSLRYTDDVQGVKRDPRVQQVQGAITWGPATLEPHHPDLFWYGIHAVRCSTPSWATAASASPAPIPLAPTPSSATGKTAASASSAARAIARRPTVRCVFGPKAIVTSPEPANITTNGSMPKRSSYYGLLVAIVDFFRTGTPPVPIDETLEIMAFMEAADLSKARAMARRSRSARVLPNLAKAGGADVSLARSSGRRKRTDFRSLARFTGSRRGNQRIDQARRCLTGLTGARRPPETRSRALVTS